MFPKYPYIDLSDRNLDFIARTVRELENEVKNFVSLNAIKYANPMQWNITRQYEKNTIVIEPNTGVAYISVKPVPSGVAISRSEYWTVVFDLSEFITKGAANFANTFESRPTTTATKVTPKGGWIVWNDVLYVALDRIDIGDAYSPVIGGNIKKMSVEDFYNLLADKIDDEIQNRIAADTALGDRIDDRIDDEIQNRIDADTALGDRIDGEIQNRIDADTALGDRIDDEIQNRIDTDTALGGRIDDEIQNRIDADDELRLLIGQSNIATRKFIFIGDSYGEGVNASDPTSPIHSYIDYCVQWLNIHSSNYYKVALSGYGFARTGYTFLSLLASLDSVISDKESITDIIVCGGANDTPDGTHQNVLSAITTFCQYAKVNYPKATVSVGMISYNYEGSSSNYRINRVFRLYNQGIVENGGVYLNGIENAIHETDAFQSDGHPNEKGQKQIARALISCIRTGYCTINNEAQLLNTVTFADIWDSPTWSTLFTCQYGNTVEIINNGFANIALVNDITVTNREFSDYIKIGHLSNTHIIGGDFQFTTWCAPICLYLSAGTNTGAIGEFHITDGDLYVRVYNTLSQTYTIHGLRICPFAATFPSKYC